MATGNSLALSTPTSPTEGDKLTFHWTTKAADPKNWVGVYDGTRLPGTGSSLVWKYTPGASGDVQLDTSALTGGPYTAYLCAKDGYGVLAQSAPFSFKPKPAAARPHAAVDALTATQVAPGAAVSVRLAGLWQHGTGTPAYRRTGGDSWLSVGADGTVTGTAPAAALTHPAVITVEIKDPSGVTDTVTVQVPVKDPAGPLTLKAASWNLWDAGTHVTDAVEKQLRVVLTQNLDVLALQETAGAAARTLATALGWYAYQSTGSLGILSRYPVNSMTAPTTSLPAAGVTLQLPGSRGVRFWAAALDETDYGPYAIQDGQSAAQVQSAEATSTRGQQATALANAVQADAAQGAVIVAAALSSPSHLDWTAATTHPVLAWPVTVALQSAGLTDAYRAAHPDPVASPGNTWSPTRKVRGTGAEPQDRIDQVQYAGPLTLVEAHTLCTGWPQADPSTAANEWPSDTAAAVATFTL
ncbi:endonuclease/exonuclease/phosphatase family protein [Kitasatospora sp. NPDC002227]|uniref:endonuclease/exonuclease/phosphatase family protein n=1 Tax=Kitasatospora sp. NPDC002227 TaxID=3154773 RepID=UPI003317FD12